jgi:hypothetical protein
MRYSTGLLLFALLFVPVRAQPAATAEQPADGNAAIDPSWQTPTAEEASQWAQALAAAVRQNDFATYNTLVDWDTVAERATTGIPCDEGLRRGFKAAFQRDIEKTGGAGAQLCRGGAAGGHFQFLHIHLQDSQGRAWFRVNVSGGGLNYHDYLLAKKQGATRAVDLYAITSGEWFSAGLRRSFLRGVAQQNPASFVPLPTEEREYCQYYQQVAAMLQCLGSGRPAKAAELFDQLPEGVQRQKFVLLMYMAAAKKIDRDLYREAMKKFAACYPGDPALSVILIDDCMLAGEFDEAHRTIDRLDQAVGGDPYLGVLHCGVFCQQKRFAEGVAAARKAVAADRGMQVAYESLLRAALGAQDFSATTDALIALEQQFALNFHDLRSVPEYADYVKSAEYPRWLKSHQSPRGSSPGS